MTRIATVDIGTNTILLLVAEVGERRMEPVYEEDRYVRLGEGVDAQRRLLPAAMDRVVTALHAYRRKAEELGAGTVVIGATSASRDARNREALVRTVRDATGLTYEILTGEEEARWTFAGAVAAFDDLG
ncbi:MAG: exopolyphosphatase, partial [Rhodothermales bacterium]|nr:exopolyphosphatase [Rhodothermales bacterium]